MRKKEAQRLENSIELSIKYSRLLEEIRDTEEKNDVIKDKKIAIMKAKKININKDYIKEVKNVIDEIEKFPEDRYNLYETNQLQSKLNLLSSRNDFEIIKNNMAIKIVLDNCVNYCNTDDYLEKISEILYNDKNKLSLMKKELTKIYLLLTNKKIALSNDIVNIPLPKFKKAGLFVLKQVKKHPKVAIASAAVAVLIGVGNGIKNKHKKTKKALKQINSDDLEYVLLVNAFCLKVACDYMNEIDYYKYFKSKMKSINTIKKLVNNELFIKWYDKENNAKKLELLNRFDEYIMNNIQLIKK